MEQIDLVSVPTVEDDAYAYDLVSDLISKVDRRESEVYYDSNDEP